MFHIIGELTFEVAEAIAHKCGKGERAENNYIPIIKSLRRK
jgi:hypothetical protein